MIKSWIRDPGLKLRFKLRVVVFHWEGVDTRVEYLVPEEEIFNLPPPHSLNSIYSVSKLNHGSMTHTLHGLGPSPRTGSALVIL